MGINKLESLIKFITDSPRYAIYYTKIKDELVWEPTISFDEGIKKTVNDI